MKTIGVAKNKGISLLTIKICFHVISEGTLSKLSEYGLDKSKSDDIKKEECKN